MLAIFLAALVVVATLVAILNSFRLLPRGNRAPWLALGAAIVLIAGWRISHALAHPRALFDSDSELILIFATLMLLAVQSIDRLVAEAKRLGMEKRHTDERHRELVTHLPLVAAYTGRNGNVEFLNASPEWKWSELPSAEAPRWETLIHSEERAGLESALARAFRGDTVRFEGRVRHQDGTWHWMETLFYPRRDQGEVSGVNSLTWDVTPQRSLEDRLRNVQKMEALGAMGGGIAHDFNNMLAVIVGSMELAVRKLDPTHEAISHLDAAQRAAMRAGEHARQLLAFSRQSVLNPQPVNLNEICQEAVGMIRPTVDPRIEINVETAPDIWTITGSSGELVQLLVNLLLNSRDVLPHGGQITVATENVVLDETHESTQPEATPGEYVRLQVTDNGPGMSRDVRARIFEPFFTTKPHGTGTGLGLAMVYGSVRQHGGWVECDSEIGRGTCFSVYFPRASPPSETEGASNEALPGGSETILLVDDDPDLRSVGAETLTSLGYEVLSAADGVAALEIYRAARGRIDLVILDLSMPRMNGMDTLAELRQLDPNVKVLMTSGHWIAEDGQKLTHVGARGFMGKPYRLTELAKAVRAALDGKKGATKNGGEGGIRTPGTGLPRTTD